MGEDATGAYNFIDLHQGYSRRRLDSAWGHVVASVGGDVGCGFLPIFYTFP